MPSAIRTATAADLLTVHALIERSYRGDTARGGWTHEADLLQGERTRPDVLAAIIADPLQRLLVLDDAVGAPAACVLLADAGGGVAYLGMLAVDPARQADGVGRRMIAAAESTARGFGATIIEMTVIAVRTELIAYYQRRGYALTGETRAFPDYVAQQDPPLTLVVMAKPLAAG